MYSIIDLEPLLMFSRGSWSNNSTSCRRLSSSVSSSKSGLLLTPGRSCHSVGEQAEMDRRGDGDLLMDCWGTFRLLMEMFWVRVWGCRRTWGRGGRALCDSLGEWFGEEDALIDRVSEWDSRISLFWTTSLYSWYNWESAREREIIEVVLELCFSDFTSDTKIVYHTKLNKCPWNQALTLIHISRRNYISNQWFVQKQWLAETKRVYSHSI